VDVDAEIGQGLAVIYLDNAASTRPFDDVIELMSQVMREDYANPSSAHPAGAAARRRIEVARAQLAAAIGDATGEGELVWTSGGTESDAIGLVGAARARPGAPIVVTGLEHDAVLRTAGELGAPLNVVAPRSDGTVTVDDVLAAITPDTGVVALVRVQNEIGTLQPVAAIARAVRGIAPRAHVHCDAIQALGKIDVDVRALGVDSCAFAGHKLHGPKGVGATWLRRGASVRPLWLGGGQQGDRRSGTQDAPGVAGFGLAAARTTAHLSDAHARWRTFTAQLLAAAASTNVEHRVVGEAERAPHILPIAFRGLAAGALRNTLASRGIAVSAGSACADRDAKPSRILAAVGLPPDHGMVRFSFGHDTRGDDVARACEVLAEVVRDLS
jgi:cysteine desulfurase